MPYDLFQHRHNFAAWAAARGAQRRFSDVGSMVEALEASGIREFLGPKAPPKVDREAFKRAHRKWCTSICRSWKRMGLAGITYGRAAKLVALYLKAMIVTGGHSHTSLSAEAHPPVDRILLQALARKLKHPQPLRAHWRTVAWTKLDAKGYYTLIDQLRGTLEAKQPFWKLEADWNPQELGR